MKLNTCPHWLALLLLTPTSVLATLPTLPNDQQQLQQTQATTKALTGLQLPFIANNGQTDPQVSFYAQTFAGTVYVTRTGELVYALPGKDKKPSWTLVERFAEGKTLPIGKIPNTSQVSYIKNQQGKAVTQNAKTYGKVALGEVFKGIQVELVAYGDNVEKVYTVAAGADAGRIKMAVAGANCLSLDAQGALLAETGNGPVRFTPPIAWQEKQGVKTPVPVSYAVANNQYGFQLGDYDHSQPVMIDPLLQATYLGANSRDRAKAIAVSPQSGDVYVIGYTKAPGSGFTNDFPGTAGGYQPNQGTASLTMFLARLTADLKGLVQTTYFSPPAAMPDDGSDGTHLSLKIHPHNGDAYVFYQTDPNQYATNPMPGNQGSAVFCDSTSSDYAVTRLSADLRQVVQSTCLPAFPDAKKFTLLTPINIFSPIDDSERFAIHPVSGDLYFGGSSFNSTDVDRYDAAVVRIAKDLKSYVDHTTFGGSKYDIIQGVTIHPTTGDVYVSGVTSFNDFPITASSFQPKNASQTATGMRSDAFVAYLSADLDVLKAASYLGGALEDWGSQIIIDQGNDHSVYVLSRTTSNDFPGLAGGAITDVTPTDSQFGAGVLSKLSSDLTQINQSTLVRLLSALTFDLRLLQSPINADILCLPSHNVGIGLDSKVLRFSPDLKTLKGSPELYPGGVGFQLVIKGYALSPVTGDIYLTGHEYDKKTSYIHPGTQGGYQPSSSLTIGGQEDSFIARYSSDDIGVGSGGNGNGSGGGSDNGGGTGNGGGAVSNPAETPKTFKFATKKRVKRNALITSSKVKIKGIKAGSAPISVQNGEYSLGCKKKGFTSLSGVIKNNKTVCVRHQSASTKKSVVTTILTIGGATGGFSSSTK